MEKLVKSEKDWSLLNSNVSMLIDKCAMLSQMVTRGKLDGDKWEPSFLSLKDL